MLANAGHHACNIRLQCKHQYSIMYWQCLERTGYVFCGTLVDHVLAVTVMGNTNHDLSYVNSIHNNLNWVCVISIVSSVICGHFMVLEFCYMLVRTLIMPQCTCAWCLHWILGVSLSWLSYYSTGIILCELCCVVLLVACMCFFNINFYVFIPCDASLGHACPHTCWGSIRMPSCNAFWKIPLRSRKLAISSGRTQPFSPQ